MENRVARRVLEDEWHKPLTEAKAHLDLTRQLVIEIDRKRAEGLYPSPDGSFAYQSALHRENLALEKYYRVLYTFSDLVLYGTVLDGAKRGKQYTGERPEEASV